MVHKSTARQIYWKGHHPTFLHFKFKVQKCRMIQPAIKSGLLRAFHRFRKSLRRSGPKSSEPWTCSPRGRRLKISTRLLRVELEFSATSEGTPDGSARYSS